MEALNKDIRVLKIKEFGSVASEGKFYANALSDHLQKFHNEINGRHKHDFFLTVLFTHGEGTHEIDFNSYKVSPGSIFFLTPGQVHLWTLTANAEGFIFFHDRHFYESRYSDRLLSDFPFFATGHNTPKLQLTDQERIKIDWLFKELLEEYQTFQEPGVSKLISLMDVLYIECSRYYWSATSGKEIQSSRYQQQLQAFENLLEAYYKTAKFPSFYAEKLNITTKHLNRITQSTLGKSTSALISERVLLEARRLMIHANKSFAEIGFDLGFEDYAYFSKWFKLQTGMSPSEFIRRHKA